MARASENLRGNLIPLTVLAPIGLRGVLRSRSGKRPLSLRHCSQFGLDPASNDAFPRSGVGQEMGDDALAAVCPVVLSNRAQGGHGVEIRDGTEIGLAPVPADFRGDFVEWAGHLVGFTFWQLSLVKMDKALGFFSARYYLSPEHPHVNNWR